MSERKNMNAVDFIMADAIAMKLPLTVSAEMSSGKTVLVVRIGAYPPVAGKTRRLTTCYMDSPGELNQRDADDEAAMFVEGFLAGIDYARNGVSKMERGEAEAWLFSSRR